MNMKIIFKGLALINFVVLVTLFLLFRNGSFNKYLNNNKIFTSPNGGTPTKISNDTSAQIKDTIQRPRLSSSKSLVIIDNLRIENDSSKITQDSIPFNPSEEDKTLMHSSKSGIIIDPKMIKLDSIILKNEKSKKKKN